MAKSHLRNASQGGQAAAFDRSNDIAVAIHGSPPRTGNHDTTIIVELMTSAAGAARLLDALESGHNRFVLTEIGGSVSIRSNLVVTKPASAPTRLSRIADAWIDWEHGSVERRRHRTVLSRTERRLLACLLEHDGEPVTHRQLVAAGWPRQRLAVSQNLLGVYIHYLRRRLASVGLNGVIKTVRRVGYVIVAPSDGALAEGAVV